MKSRPRRSGSVGGPTSLGPGHRHDHHEGTHTKGDGRHHHGVSFPTVAGIAQESDTPEAFEMRERLFDAIDLLDEEERFIVEAVYFESLSLRELGLRMGLDHPMQVARRRDKALAALRKTLGDMDETA